MMRISEKLLRDVKNGLKWALEKLPDTCDCPSEATYMERDTGALIHDEEHCVTTTRGHIEVVLEELSAVMENGTSLWIVYAKDDPFIEEIVLLDSHAETLNMERLLNKIYGRQNVYKVPCWIGKLPQNLIEAMEASKKGEVVDYRFSTTKWAPAAGNGEKRP